MSHKLIYKLVIKLDCEDPEIIDVKEIIKIIKECRLWKRKDRKKKEVRVYFVLKIILSVSLVPGKSCMYQKHFKKLCRVLISNYT